MTLRKKLLLLVAALVVAGLLALSFRPQAVPVSLATAERGPLAVTVEQEGKTRVRERYEITAPVAGFAPRITLDVGDPVRAGETLVVLRPTPATLLDPRSRAEAEARVAQAQAMLEAEQSRLRAARASDDLARRDYERLKPLHERGDVSRSTLDRAEAEARQAAANLRAARYAVDAARQELRAAEAALASFDVQSDGEVAVVPLLSPADASVLAVYHESQGVVNAGEPLLAVGDPRSLEVAADVLSADAVRIHPGMRVVFERWGGEPLEGRVRTVEPAGFTEVSALGVEEQRVLAIADITAPPEQWARLGDGYRVEARFFLWEGEDILKAPASAVFRDGDGWAVFVAEAGRARKRPVEVGHRGGLEFEIRSGLQPGERLITHPDDSIAEGTRITPRQG